MRPRKIVAVMTESEQTAAVLRIVLDVHGYAVWTVGSRCEARRAIRRADACVFVGMPRRTSDRLEDMLYRRRSGNGRIFIPARGTRPEAEWIASLLLQVKIEVKRKRGPRVGTAYLAAVQSAHGEMRREKLAREKWRAA